MNKLKKFFFKKFLVRRVNETYIKTPALKEVLVPMKSTFLIACPINIDLLEMQYASITKNIEDAYDYLVVDTSTKEEQAKATEEFCEKNNISYVRPPKNPGTDASLKHGFTLNWTFYNVVLKLMPEKFAFFESDVFIVKKGSLLAPWEGRDFWGVFAPSYEEGDKLWRLWPGFCFFRKNFYEGKKFNFLPIRHLDTAGGNFGYFKNADTSHLIAWKDMEVKSVTGDAYGEYHSTRYFVHLLGILSLSDDPLRKEALRKKREMAREITLGTK